MKYDTAYPRKMLGYKHLDDINEQNTEGSYFLYKILIYKVLQLLESLKPSKNHSGRLVFKLD